MTDTPSLLAFQRSIAPTDAVFFAVLDNGSRLPIALTDKTVLGTESQFDPKGESKPTGNPQRVECATMPRESSVLGIEFDVTFVGASLKPHSCDVREWRSDLMKLVAAYGKADGFRTLGGLYAANIANGRWAWKNRMFAESFAVKVTAGSETFSFDAKGFRLDDVVGTAADAEVARLGELIAAGLRGDRVVRMTVVGTLEVGKGATVYPSQEFASKDDSDDAKGKVLFGVSYLGCERCAAFHEQKIGNAIRTIDVWHKGTDGVAEAQPLPVNPYAQAREEFVVVRSKSSGNTDFYTLLKKNVKKYVADAEAGNVSDDLHFVVANLIRGGVFGMGSKKK